MFPWADKMNCIEIKMQHAYLSKQHERFYGPVYTAELSNCDTSWGLLGGKCDFTLTYAGRRKRLSFAQYQVVHFYNNTAEQQSQS